MLFEMVSLPYEQILEKLKSKSELPEQEIDSRIKEKIEAFNGLVSKEGAALILANELGIKIIENPSEPSKLKINQLLSGMQSIDILGKVLRVYPVRSFNKNGREGKVGSVILGDETGDVRVTFWNNQTSHLNDLKRGSVLKIVNAYSRENLNKGVELNVSDKSEVTIDPEGESVDSAGTGENVKKIADVNESDGEVVVFGTVSDVSDLRFFEICDSCGKRAKPDEATGIYECSDKHASAKHKYSYLSNINLDDGSSIRVVLFRNTLSEFLEKPDEEILSYRGMPEMFDELKTDFIGKVVKVFARPKTSSFSGELELIADFIEPSSVEEMRKAGSSGSSGALNEASERDEPGKMSSSESGSKSSDESDVESSSIDNG